MLTLVDSSVWIDYFRGGRLETANGLDFLIDENLVAVNELILAELVPFLKVKGKQKIIRLLYSLAMLPLSIDWDEIIEYQHKCLRQGANGIGIPDLIIAQNAIQNHCRLYSLDNHFQLLKSIIRFELMT